MSGRCVEGPWRVLGTGAALPGPALETGELLARVDGAFGTRLARRGARLAERLGVRTRHMARDWRLLGEGPREEHTNPRLAASALGEALREGRLGANELGYVVGHTTTPHTLLPANVAWVADELGYAGPYAELRQACTGFAHALQMAAGLLAVSGGPVGLVGSETGSVFLDPRRAQEEIGQLVNLVQMGDGAGAMIVGRDDGEAGARIARAYVGSLGPGVAPGFWMSEGGSGSPGTRGLAHFEHDFGGVKERGASLFERAIEGARAAGVDVAGVDYFLPHQANAGELPLRLAERLGVARERMIVDADEVGNLGSASIWVALHRLRVSGRLRKGERVLVLGAEATKYLFGGFVYTHG